jgi:hypothetical protein
MSYDRRYSEQEITRITKKGRRQGLMLLIALYVAIRYFIPELIQLLP